MTTKKLKKLLGEAGAGLDGSNGQDRLYDVLKEIVTEMNALLPQYEFLRSAMIYSPTQFNLLKDSVESLITQFNALRTNYNAETNAAHTATTATAVAATSAADVPPAAMPAIPVGVEIE